MKVKSLEVCNIGIVEHEIIEFEKPLNLFYGQIREGKSTLAINSVKLLFGGTFPADLLRHGTSDGFVELVFDKATLRREFYTAKDGTIKARPIKYLVNGIPQDKPIDKIRALLNPFLIDQNFLVNKTPLERERYFVELFDIETDELDNTIKASEEQAKQLRWKINQFGEIDTKPVNQVDVEGLKAKRQNLIAEKETLKIEYGHKCIAIDEKNQAAEKAIEQQEKCELKIETLKEEIAEKQKKLKECEEWLLKQPKVKKIEYPKLPTYESTEEIDKQLSDAAVANVEYDAYLNRLEKQKEKESLKSDLREAENNKAKSEKEKRLLLSTVNDKCSIDGLLFDEAGKFSYEGTAADMLSTSQLMDLSSKLSAMYPEGLGLELIDRAESLGESVFLYVDKAKRDKSTILATIVGEKPAKVPEGVGVFVVEKGCIKNG